MNQNMETECGSKNITTMELKDVQKFSLPIAVELNNGGSKVYNRIAVAVGNTDDEFTYVTLRIGTGAKSFTHSVLLSENRVKPILRPISDMTEEEKAEMMNQKHKYNTDNSMSHAVTDAAYRTEWAIKKGFDLFGLINLNLAIDKTNLNP